MAKKLKKKIIRKKTFIPHSLLKEARWVVKNRATLLGTIPNSADYEVQEKIITNLFEKTCPHNTNVHFVRTKTSLLNLFYSTFITAIPTLAKDITLIPNIDTRIAVGDKTLVPAIAKAGSPKYTYRSFATKYCACHNPKAFPIYDKIVREFLAKVISKGNLPPYKDTATTVLSHMENSYSYYVDLYDAFMSKYHLNTLTYRQVDWYIWVAHKCKTSAHLSHLDLFKLTK